MKAFKHKTLSVGQKKEVIFLTAKALVSKGNYWSCIVMNFTQRSRYPRARGRLSEEYGDFYGRDSTSGWCPRDSTIGLGLEHRLLLLLLFAEVEFGAG